MPSPRRHRPSAGRRSPATALVAAASVAAVLLPAAVAPPTAAAAGDDPAFLELFLVDFEGLEEGTILSDQFASLGVSFSMADGSPEGPVVAVSGPPVVAFVGAGDDAPMASGEAALTDPVVDGDPFAPAAVRMDFDPPVTSVRFFVTDIDATDAFLATARAGDRVVDTASATVGDPGAGNGQSAPVLLQDPEGGITSVVLEPTGGEIVGWALDFLTFTRPCPEGTCGPRVRIAQETAPGAGDFVPRGELLAFPWSGDAASFYAYDVPEGESWNGPLGLEPDRSVLVLGNTVEGLVLALVHDRAVPDDPDGGEAETRIRVLGSETASILVRDDPFLDAYGEDPDGVEFTARHRWDTCCTDGYAVGPLLCGARAFVSFDDVDGDPGTPTIEGLDSWVAASADGGLIELALEPGRRVRLTVVPDAACPADLNCDEQVTLADLLILLSSWGPCDQCIADIDGGGAVGFEDLVPLLSQWGPC